MSKYTDAFTQVYVILNELDEEEKVLENLVEK